MVGWKKSGMLQFTMGTVGLDDPMDKRYFYALNSDGKMVAFIVFVPFPWKKRLHGRCDETRKRRAQRSHGDDHLRGISGIQEEGIGYGSLGVAPLAGLNAES